jgi:predicted nucleic acid-binding protein
MCRRCKGSSVPSVVRLASWVLDFNPILQDIARLTLEYGTDARRRVEADALDLAGFEQRDVSRPRNFRSLRRRGITVRKNIDLLIGTWCIENGRPLLHNDNDFLPMVRYLGLREVPVAA